MTDLLSLVANYTKAIGDRELIKCLKNRTSNKKTPTNGKAKWIPLNIIFNVKSCSYGYENVTTVK